MGVRKEPDGSFTLTTRPTRKRKPLEVKVAPVIAPKSPAVDPRVGATITLDDGEFTRPFKSITKRFKRYAANTDLAANPAPTPLEVVSVTDAAPGGKLEYTIPGGATDHLIYGEVLPKELNNWVPDRATPAAAVIKVLGSGAPTNTVAPSISGTGFIEDGALTFNTGTWTGSPTLRTMLQLDGIDVPGTADVTSYTPVLAHRGKQVGLRVWANGYEAETSIVTPITVLVKVHSLKLDDPTIAGTGNVGDAITRTNGRWVSDDTPVPAITGQWQKDGSNIGGATGSSYTPVSGDETHVVRWGEYLTGYSGNKAYSQPITIKSATTDPYNITRPTLSGTGIETQVITLTRGTWNPGTPPAVIGSNFQISSDRVTYADIVGATGLTLTALHADIGKQVRARVRPSGFPAAEVFTDPITITAAPGVTFPANLTQAQWKAVQKSASGDRQGLFGNDAGNGATINVPSDFDLMAMGNVAPITVDLIGNATKIVDASGNDTIEFANTIGDGITVFHAPIWRHIATGQRQLAHDPNDLIVLRTATVTLSLGSPGVVNFTAHGMVVNQPLRFTTTGALPTGLALNTTYYVQSIPTADTLQVAATVGGTAINFTGGQSGAHTISVRGAYGAMIIDGTPPPPPPTDDFIAAMGTPASASFLNEAIKSPQIALNGNTMNGSYSAAAILAIAVRALQGNATAKTELKSRLTYCLGAGNGDRNPPMNGLFCENAGVPILAAALVCKAQQGGGGLWSYMGADLQNRFDLLADVSALNAAVTISDSNWHSGNSPFTITGWDASGNPKGDQAFAHNLGLPCICMALMTMAYYGGPAAWEARVAYLASDAGRTAIDDALNTAGMTELRRTFSWKKLTSYTKIQGHRGGITSKAPTDDEIRQSVSLNAAGTIAQVSYFKLRMASWKKITRDLIHNYDPARGNAVAINSKIGLGWHSKHQDITVVPDNNWSSGDPEGLPINTTQYATARTRGRQSKNSSGNEVDPPYKGLHGGWCEIYTGTDDGGGRSDVPYSVYGWRIMMSMWLVLWCFGYIDPSDPDWQTTATIINRCCADLNHKGIVRAPFLSIAHAKDLANDDMAEIAGTGASAYEKWAASSLFKIWSEVLATPFGL